MNYTLHRNMTFLLWKAKPLPKGWAQSLSESLAVSLERAQELLDGAVPTPDEVARLAEQLGVSPEDAGEIELWERANVDVLKANLARVLSEVEHGTKGGVAREVGMSRNTLSRWTSGEQVPEEKPREKLARALGLASGEALRDEPLFLSPRPVTLEVRRQRILERLRTMPGEKLHPLLPALEKLTD